MREFLTSSIFLYIFSRVGQQLLEYKIAFHSLVVAEAVVRRDLDRLPHPHLVVVVVVVAFAVVDVILPSFKGRRSVE